MKKAFALATTTGTLLLPAFVSHLLIPNIVLILILLVTGPDVPPTSLASLASALVSIVGARDILGPGIAISPDLLFVI